MIEVLVNKLSSKIRPMVVAGLLALNEGGGCGEDLLQPEIKLIQQSGVTNKYGQVTVNSLPIKVEDEEGLWIEGSQVFYVDDGREYVLMATKSRHHSHLETGKISSLPQKVTVISNSNSNQEQQEFPLFEQIVAKLYTTNLSEVITGTIPRTLLAEDYLNYKYCMSKEAISSSTVEAPVGFIGLILGQDKQQLLQNFVVQPLRSLFEKYIVKKFGDHEGYEVWVPKVAVNLCGENYQELLCTISSQELSERIWSMENIPYWHIKGPCEVKKLSEDDGFGPFNPAEDSEFYTPSENSPPSESDPTPNYIFKEEFDGPSLDKSKWKVVLEGGYSVNNGVLSISEGTILELIQGIANPGDYALEIELQGSIRILTPNIYFISQPDGKAYLGCRQSEELERIIGLDTTKMSKFNLIYWQGSISLDHNFEKVHDCLGEEDSYDLYMMLGTNANTGGKIDQINIFNVFY